MDGLDRAIKYFGSAAALARALRVRPMSVSHWKKRGVPVGRALQIHEVTDGNVPIEAFSSVRLCKESVKEKLSA